MKHYFSLHFVSYYWFNKDSTRDLNALSKKVVGLGYLKEALPPEEAKLYSLLSKAYFTMPDLMALDFYVAMRDGTGHIPQKRKVFSKVVEKIRKLPPGGWNVEKFCITAIKPFYSSDIYIIHGMAYDITTLATSMLEKTRLFTYSGKDFVAKIRTIIKEGVVFCQATPEGMFWGVRSFLERKRMKRWRKIPCKLKKKVFLGAAD